MRHVKVAENVRAKGAIELFVVDVLKRRLLVLVGCIIHEDMQPTELTHGTLDRVLADGRLSHVAGE